jgi:hypothetical protein
VKVDAPALAPLLRSNAQGDILALVLLRPDEEFSLADIGRAVGALPATVHREVSRLVDATVLLDRVVGRSRLVRSNPEYALLAPLSELVLLTYGPKALLPGILRHLAGLDRVYIYGSWAARYEGESGPPPRDVDVILIGSPSRADMLDATREAERVLRREVNMTRVSAADWDGRATPFIETVRSRPVVAL